MVLQLARRDGSTPYLEVPNDIETLELIRMAASPGFFGVFFSGHFQIHGNLENRLS